MKNKTWCYTQFACRPEVDGMLYKKVGKIRGEDKKTIATYTFVKLGADP
jgi:hypothetical protein